MPELTLARLKEVLDYNPETGRFIWLKTLSRRAVAGKVAGSFRNNDGYRQIGIDGSSYLAHRLAWMYQHGAMPPVQTDHGNGVRDDNRSGNLSPTDAGGNRKNRGRDRRNKSGVNGVYWHKQRSKWCAQIRVNKGAIHLGLFSSLKKAKVARKAAEKKYGFHPNHGLTHSERAKYKP